MSDRVSRMLGEVNTILAALPGVFSSAQWGGRAYKLPGPNGSRSRPKLRAFVSPSRDGRAVGVSFKLPPARAANIIEMHNSMADPLHFSHALRGLAVDLTRISNDLRILSSGPTSGMSDSRR